jgi:DNA-binding SARP family transcriptional activator
VTGRAAQKRRLALLVLLARAPHRCASRDRLAAYLWPESDSVRARHVIAVAVYELRKTLGESALLSRGDDIELPARSIPTDVDAFETAANDGDWANAVDAYTGPFLDGFHIGGAPEFERWVDTERDRLSRRFSTALEALACGCGAAGDTAGAVDAWRRRTALNPYDAWAVQQLMLALEAAGDRAAAIRQARAHAKLLRDELHAKPNPDVEALAERLRTEPAFSRRAATTRPATPWPAY